MLKHAVPKQLDEIYKKIYQNKEWFPNTRKDYIGRMIEKGNVVYDNGILIVYKEYKRRSKIGTDCDCVAQKGDVKLHQILNTEPGSGKAGKILKKFLEMVSSNVWLTVDEENEHAIKFYEKNGFEKAGKINWSDGPGFIYYYENGGAKLYF